LEEGVLIPFVIVASFVTGPLWYTAATSNPLPAIRAVDAHVGEESDLQDEQRVALRLKAHAHIESERTRFSEFELTDIEARYRSAHVEQLRFVRRPEGVAILRELIERYPGSNRAGCAVLDLARLSSGATRERYLRKAIANHSDAWFETGVQVGALARAMLAVHLAGLERFDEAERVAAELVTMFPGAIDDSGASLDDVLESIRLLRTPKGGARRRPLNP
jgi:hypothetical protein